MVPPDDIASAILAPAPDPATDRAAEYAARNHALRMAALEAVIDHGLGLLDEIRRRTLSHDQFIAGEGRSEPADLGLTFDRISRAIRYTVAQHERLEVEAAKTSEQKQAEAAARAAAEAQRAAQAGPALSPEEQARKQEQDRKLRLVERAVRRAIDATEDYDERDERLEDLDERLEEVEDLGLDRPVGAVVASICRAMRLPFDLSLWEDEPWALAEAEAKPDGSPYAKWRPSANDRAGERYSDHGSSRHGIGPP